MGKFVIFRGRNGQFYWHFKANNEEIICVSEGYTSKENAQASIGIMKVYGISAPVVDATLNSVYWVNKIEERTQCQGI